MENLMNLTHPLACIAEKACGLQAAVLVVPFVDVVSTMSDPNLPATVMEYEVQMLLAASFADNALLIWAK